MSKPTLTPAGVQTLLGDLYALPNAQLQAEADALGTDFVTWLKNHFDLTAQQELFIDEGLTGAFLTFVASRVPFALVHRLPIAFCVLGAPSTTSNDDPPELGKIVTTTDNTSQTTNGAAPNDGASGNIVFAVQYLDAGE